MTSVALNSSVHIKLIIIMLSAAMLRVVNKQIKWMSLCWVARRHRPQIKDRLANYQSQGRQINRKYKPIFITEINSNLLSSNDIDQKTAEAYKLCSH